MKSIAFSIIFLISITKSFGQDTCLKLTCLTPYDTVYQTDYSHKTIFLIESIKDTLEILNTLCSCGCEAPRLAHRRVYPSYPDTLIIYSLVMGRTGNYKKYTKLFTKSGCYQTINSNFYVSKYLPPTEITVNDYIYDKPIESPYNGGDKNESTYRLFINNFGQNNLFITEIKNNNPKIKIIGWDDQLRIYKGEKGWLHIDVKKSNSKEKLAIEIYYNGNNKLLWSEN